MAHVFVRLVPLAILGASFVACGGSDVKSTTPTETTGAMASETSQSDMVRLQKERDDAQKQLADERARYEQERQRYDMESSDRKARDEIAMRILRALDSAGTEMAAMKDQAAKAPAKTRQAIDKSMDDVKSKKEKLHAELQKLHGEQVGVNVESFKMEVESSIADLDSAVSQLRDSQSGNKNPAAIQPASGKAKTGGAGGTKGGTKPAPGGDTKPPPR